MSTGQEVYVGPSNPVEYKRVGERIVRTDKEGTIIVAQYDEQGRTVYLEPDHTKFRSAVLRFLNGEKLEYDTVLIRGDRKDVSDVPIPPKPRMNGRYGDKTPELVEWYQKYKPNEFKARYGIKGKGKVKVVEKRFDPERGENVAHVVEVDALIAARKTHLTEKPEAQEDNSVVWDE